MYSFISLTFSPAFNAATAASLTHSGALAVSGKTSTLSKVTSRPSSSAAFRAKAVISVSMLSITDSSTALSVMSASPPPGIIPKLAPPQFIPTTVAMASPLYRVSSSIRACSMVFASAKAGLAPSSGLLAWEGLPFMRILSPREAHITVPAFSMTVPSSNPLQLWKAYIRFIFFSSMSSAHSAPPIPVSSPCWNMKYTLSPAPSRLTLQQRP